MSKVSAEQEAAKAEVEKLKAKFVADAQADLDALVGQEHAFEMKGSCKDKTGELTEVLRVNLDRKGFLGMYMQLGQAAEFENEQGDMVFNDSKIAAYFGFMANIDLTNESNLEAVGISAIGKGRDVVKAFFTYRLAADL